MSASYSWEGKGGRYGSFRLRMNVWRYIKWLYLLLFIIHYYSLKIHRSSDSDQHQNRRFVVTHSAPQEIYQNLSSFWVMLLTDKGERQNINLRGRGNKPVS